MVVLQVAWRLSPTGGIPQVVRRLVATMDKERFDVHVCSARPIVSEDHLESLGSGITVHTLRLGGPRTIVSRLTGSLRLIRLIRELRPHVVHIHSGIAWLLAPTMLSRTYRGPLVIEVHDSPQSARVSRLNWAVERAMLRGDHAVPLVHSESVADSLVAAAGLSRRQIRCIPIGLPVHGLGDPERGREWRRSRGIGADELLVSHVGRLVPSKNPDAFARLAVAVARRRSDAVFVMAGDGPARQGLETFALEAGIGTRLRIVGSEPDLEGLLAASDVFVSTSRYEGFGMAILEALASSTAVVATDVGATKELVTNGLTGLLVSPGDERALEEAVVALLGDPDMRLRLATAGSRSARENYDLSTMVRRYEAMYDDLLAHPVGPSPGEPDQ
jgi:glycosyltransferase involved in cell wall biosynthesis